MAKKINWLIYIILGAYLLISIAFWLLSDPIADWGMTANPILVTIVNFITNPFYVGSVILVMEILFRAYKLRREALNYLRVIVASVIFSLSLDIVSILHSFRLNCTLPAESQVSIYFDTVIGKPLCHAISGTFGSFLLYVLIAFFMAVLSLFIASPSKFIGLVKSETGFSR